MVGLKNNSEEDMSMEDILSSIRKYVSEEDLPKNNNAESENVIKPEANIIELDEETVSPNNNAAPNTESVAELSQQDASPFNKLAEALRAYGKPKKAPALNFNMTVDQFFTSIVESYIQKWAAENLKTIVEQIVVREIEKLKSE